MFVLLSLIAASFSTYSMWYQSSAVTSISMFGFWFSLFMLVFYLFHVIECFYKIPWLKIVSFLLHLVFFYTILPINYIKTKFQEMIFNVAWPLLYLISAASAAAYTGLHFSFMMSLVCMTSY